VFAISMAAPGDHTGAHSENGCLPILLKFVVSPLGGPITNAGFRNAPDQRILLWETNASHQFGKARVSANRIEPGIHLQKDQLHGAFLIRSFEVVQCALRLL
jgi:hypothetical protein